MKGFGQENYMAIVTCKELQGFRNELSEQRQEDLIGLSVNGMLIKSFRIGIVDNLDFLNHVNIFSNICVICPDKWDLQNSGRTSVE